MTENEPYKGNLNTSTLGPMKLENAKVKNNHIRGSENTIRVNISQKVFLVTSL